MHAGELDTLGDVGRSRSGLADQLDAAWAAVPDPIGGLPSADDIDQVVLVGMGGSGIAGDVVAALAGPTSPVPVVTLKDSVLPGFVGPRTLVVALSFSGSTAETLAGATAALERGAPLVAVSAGGALGGSGRVGRWSGTAVDGSIPMPRPALGALVGAGAGRRRGRRAAPGGRQQGAPPLHSSAAGPPR